MYSTYKGGKSVVGARFIQTLKKGFTTMRQFCQKNVYNDVLDDIVDKCNNMTLLQ